MLAGPGTSVERCNSKANAVSGEPAISFFGKAGVFFKGVNLGFLPEVADPRISIPE